MHLFLGLPLALCALSLVSSAPVREPRKDMQNPEFQDAAENGHSLISKILNEVPAAYKSWIRTESLSLDNDDSAAKLQYMKETLDLPTTPALTPLLERVNPGACLGQIAEGLRLHRTLLKVVSKLVHAKSERVEGLLHDLRDLLTQIHKMQNLIGKANSPKEPAVSESQLQADLAPRLKDEYMSQVAAHLVMYELRKFGRNVSRSLRSMITVDLESQTTLGQR